jgi:hypothetical protein
MGFVRRTKNNYSLTIISSVIYNAVLEIEIAVTNYWKLKAFDSIQPLNQIGSQELTNLIKRPIDSERLEEILGQCG